MTFILFLVICVLIYFAVNALEEGDTGVLVLCIGAAFAVLVVLIMLGGPK